MSSVILSEKLGACSQSPRLTTPSCPAKNLSNKLWPKGERSLTGGIKHHQQRLLFLLQEPSEVLRHKQRTPQVTHYTVTEAHPPGTTVVGGAGEHCKSHCQIWGLGVRVMACQEPKEPETISSEPPLHITDGETEAPNRQMALPRPPAGMKESAPGYQLYFQLHLNNETSTGSFSCHKRLSTRLYGAAVL